MRKRKKMRLKMEKWYAKNGKHLSKAERWMWKLFILKLSYPRLSWMRLLIKLILRFLPPDSRPGLLFSSMDINATPYLTHSESLFKELIDSNGGLYKTKVQDKMKFGRPQLEQNGDTRKRNISSPVQRLKVIQQRANIPLQSIELPPSMYGGVKGKNNIQNAKMHVGSKFFLTIDLKNYFGNISSDRIFQTLVDKGFSHSNARAITRLSTVNYKLPQGAPTSPVLANLVFSSTARELELFCQKNKIIFTNFVDDLTFSSKRDFKQLASEILALLKRNNFIVNQRKIHYRLDSCEITGLFVRNGKMYPQKNMMDNLHNKGVRAYVNLVDKYNSKSRV